MSHFRERCPIPSAPFIQLSKSPVNEPASRFPSGAPIEIDARLQNLFYLFFMVPNKISHRVRCFTSKSPCSLLSNSPVDEPTTGCPAEPPIKRNARLQSLSFVTYRVPSKADPRPGSPNRAPLEKNTPYLEPSFS